MDHQQHRHSWPERETKRSLSADRDKEPKRCRSVYFAESPGGTLHETSPTKVYQQDVRKMKTMSLPERPATSYDTTQKKQPQHGIDRLALTEQQLGKMTVHEKLMQGIKMGLNKEMTQKSWVEQMMIQDALARPNGPLYHSTTVEGMQSAVDAALHVSPLLEPAHVERENIAIWGPLETVHHELTIMGPGKGPYLKTERRADRKKRTIHMQNRYYFM